MMMALSSGIVTAIFPAEERGRALGVVGMCVAIGLVIGPTFGGFLVHLQGSWRWVFFINLPIGLFGGLWCARMLPPLRFGRGARVDWLGGLLAVTMLTALLLAITNGSPWGWLSPAVLALLALSVMSAIAFAWQRAAPSGADAGLFPFPQPRLRRGEPGLDDEFPRAILRGFPDARAAGERIRL